MKVFNKRWYAIAYDRRQEYSRRLPLDRIVGMCAIRRKTFQYPKDFDPQTYFNLTAAGIIIHDEQEMFNGYVSRSGNNPGTNI